MAAAMDESTFDQLARTELRLLEDAFAAVDPDAVEVTTTDGMVRLDLRDGTRVVVNSHRAARQIWMAAVASAWHFDPGPDGKWYAAKSHDELRATVARLISEHAGLAVSIP